MLPRLFGAAIVQLELLGEYITGIISTCRQPERDRICVPIDVNAAGCHCSIHCHRRHAHLFGPGCAGEIGRNARSRSPHHLRGVLLLSMPAAVGLMLIRKPIVALLYQRGEFTAHSTELVAWALLWYAAGLVGHSVVEVLARAFYALHDTRTPVIIGTIAMSLNIALSFFVHLAIFVDRMDAARWFGIGQFHRHRSRNGGLDHPNS